MLVLIVLLVAGVAAGFVLLPAGHANRTMDSWKVTLETPGGPLPFGLTISRSGAGHIHVGQSERIPVDAQLTAGGIMVRFPHYDSVLALRGDPGGELSGVWKKVRGDDAPELAASAERGRYGELFDPIETDDEPGAFAGRWRVDFDSSDDDAIGVFEVDENQIATGTFLTTTGDYRYLEGRVDGDRLRLSTFDGAHAFLFHAVMNGDGTITGDFWSGDWWHETWTAVRDDDAALPDMFAQTAVVDEGALGALVLTALDGGERRVLDALDDTGAPARVIEVFGTWCPNCADAGRELAELKSEYGDKLGIVGLAFEATDDHERSARQVRRYLDRFGAGWEVLIGGVNDKSEATGTLGFLDKIRSFPTTVFLNANNEIVAVHTGFTGPATGAAYTAQREKFEQIIGSLVGAQPGGEGP